ncbi:Putative RxLR effector [Phytophthora palmivora]|uniref:RxLR effector protein n=1 Tax=Phytophthora palmivora TaxID=4796 RepID=A0A2P4XGL7_9STRA|nr:Putative RxLR effector [Phytophthora palmivora]
MRVTFVVLTAMAIITGTTAINSEPTAISTKTSNGGIHPIDTSLDDVEDQRFLRSNRVSEDGEEERLGREALNKLLDGDLSLFLTWAENGYNAKKIFNKLSVDTHEDRRWVYNKYVKYLRDRKNQ